MTSTLNELLSRALTAIYFHSAGDVADEALMEDLRQAIAELESQEQNFCSRCGKRTNDIHTCTPPQRTWIGLTDEEIINVIHPLVMADMSDQATDYEIARAIEAKLKEKNS